MFDYAAARETMLDSQIRTNDVTDRHIQAAFHKTARECFVPKSKKALAYSDKNIDLGDGRFMLRPRDIAKMVDAADIAPSDIVLDIACGRGYSVAILACLAETVVAIEEANELVTKASENLEHCNINNVAVVKGGFKAGAAEHGPFDVIFVGGAINSVPKSWYEQLADGGRIVTTIISKETTPLSKLTVYTKSGNNIGQRVLMGINAPTITGFEIKPEFTF